MSVLSEGAERGGTLISFLMAAIFPLQVTTSKFLPHGAEFYPYIYTNMHVHLLEVGWEQLWGLLGAEKQLIGAGAAASFPSAVLLKMAPS